MNIQENTFAEACYNQSSIDELKVALVGDSDKTDMAEWGLTEQQWREEIQLALDQKLEE